MHEDSTVTFQSKIETPAERTYRLIAAAIEELRPLLRADGGDCQLVGVEDNVVSVRMTGACVFCKFAATTISSLQERLIESLGMPLRIVPIPTGR